jgi:hypothetical protein
MGMAICSRPFFRWGQTMPIRRYLNNHAAFDHEAINAMSKALEEACNVLHINGQAKEREIIATRIIDLAREGVIDPTALRDRVLSETKA